MSIKTPSIFPTSQGGLPSVSSPLAIFEDRKKYPKHDRLILRCEWVRPQSETIIWQTNVSEENRNLNQTREFYLLSKVQERISNCISVRGGCSFALQINQPANFVMVHRPDCLQFRGFRSTVLCTVFPAPAVTHLVGRKSCLFEIQREDFVERFNTKKWMVTGIVSTLFWTRTNVYCDIFLSTTLRLAKCLIGFVFLYYAKLRIKTNSNLT